MLHFKNTVHALAMSNGPSVSMTTYMLSYDWDILL